MKAGNKYVFLSWYDKDYSRSGVKYRKMQSTYNLNVEFFEVPFGFTRAFRGIRRIARKSPRNTRVIICSPCHYLVLVAFLAGFTNVVLDAGWPLLDSTRIRVKKLSLFSQYFSIVKSWVIDAISFKMARIIFLESQAQVSRVTAKRKNREKYKCSYTGFNEISRTSSVIAQEGFVESLESNHTYALFRGSNNQESGLDVIIEASKLLRSNTKIVLITDKPVNYDESEKLEVHVGYISDHELDALLQKCTLMLGQFGKTSRSNHTIPHKFFEAAYYGKPYLTPKTNALLEIFPGNRFGYIDEISASCLAQHIDSIVEDRECIENLRTEIQQIYRERLSQEKITDLFINTIEEEFN